MTAAASAAVGIGPRNSWELYGPGQRSTCFFALFLTGTFQLQQRDPVTEFIYFTNGGKATSKGVDLSITGVNDKGLVVAGNLSFADSTLRESLGVGLDGSPGDRLPYTSEFNGTLSIDQDFPMGGSYTAFVGSTLAYVGERYGAFSPDATVERILMPSYSTIDLRVGREVRMAGP